MLSHRSLLLRFFKNNFILYKYLRHFTSVLEVQNIKNISLFGIFILLIILIQCISGTMLALSFVCEPMIVPTSRDEEDIEDLYSDDFFFLHERGVDFIFIFMFIHLSRKIFLRSFIKEQETAWKNGSLLFLLIHVTTFFGLSLCCTHLSDITLTIAANIIQTFTGKYGKIYYFLFTDQTLNTDTIIRCAYAHYILGFLCLVFGIIHANSMHYDYKDISTNTSYNRILDWLKNIFKLELDRFFLIIIFLNFICLFYLYENIESTSYEVFMWGDIGMVSDVRFYGVAPHWYFRAYMGWLLLCPHHYIGVFGLVILMVSIYFQPNFKTTNYKEIFIKNNDIYIIHVFTYSIFVISFLYAFSMLPYGRFYNEIGGNSGLMYSYLYIFIYLIFDLLYYPNLMINNFNLKKNKSLNKKILIDKVNFFIDNILINIKNILKIKIN